MELDAAKMIGAGIATLALAGIGIGLGNIFGSFITGVFRNPSAAPKAQTSMFLGFALTEATGLFALVIAFLILFT